MLQIILVAVNYCMRHPWRVIIVGVAIAFLCGAYASQRFAIDTDTNNLISRELTWRKREIDYQKAFPKAMDLILVVVEAPTPEQSALASRALAEALLKKPALFRSVEEEGGGPFFAKNRLLFLPLDQLKGAMTELTEAAPLIKALVRDPSLRGLSQTLIMGLRGAQSEGYPLDAAAPMLDSITKTLKSVAASQPSVFSWETLVSSDTQAISRRRLISVQPVLFTEEVEPGRRASDEIKKTAAQLKLAEDLQAHVRLTGPVPVRDEEFASLKEGAGLNSAITSAVVLLILWLAFRSLRLVLAVAITLAIGLLTTAGLAFLIGGAVNPVSTAFAVLFVGLGADFSVQLNMRYRAQRHERRDFSQAMREAAEWVGVPLTLAAAAAATGFLSFTPTSYTGLAQLGWIAGGGMLVAYLATFLLLPALMSVIKPPDEPKQIKQPRLAAIDHFLRRRRAWVIGFTALLALAGLYWLRYIQFDFNPVHLESSRLPAVATYLELSHDPRMDANAAEVLAHTTEEAKQISAKLEKLPQVKEARTLDKILPTQQKEKLHVVRRANAALASALNQQRSAEPSDNVNVTALLNTAKQLHGIAGEEKTRGAEAARRLSHALAQLADGAVASRQRATRAFVDPFEMDAEGLRRALDAGPVSRESLPSDLVRDWVAPDGRERVDVLPKGDPNNDATIRDFARAVLDTEPMATGQAVGILKWSETMITALIEAAAIATASIAVLLSIALRRIGDMLLTLTPLLVAALVTLEICGITGFRLNYANIIAFPVLLGIGVAFKIYYVSAWRRGETEFLQSALTRAVFFSALLTGAAFGSLWFSSNPGMSSMGQLLALSLACTLASAVLFQPALMGEPRKQTDGSPRG